MPIGMSVRGGAGGAETCAVRQHARPLCGAQWRDVRRAASEAKAIGAKSVSVHGVQLWFPKADLNDPGAEQMQESLRPPLDELVGGSKPDQECSGSSEKTNTKQRRAARRARKQQQSRDALAYAACGLRVVLLRALRRMRWERMQAVWTQWMRARQAMEARRREVLLYLRNLFWQAWTRPRATAGLGRLGATSERDDYIHTRATRAWIRFRSAPNVPRKAAGIASSKARASFVARVASRRPLERTAGKPPTPVKRQKFFDYLDDSDDGDDEPMRALVGALYPP